MAVRGFARRSTLRGVYRQKEKGAAHLGVDGDDVEHAVEDEGEETVDGDEDDPRRAFTVRG